jgi:predicted GH43/DUF377 family glycosyl hydrolase
VTSSLIHRLEATLAPDPGRVIARLFLPGEELPMGHSRTGAVVARVLALPEAEVEQLATQLLVAFSHRHRDYSDLLRAHAAIISPHLHDAAPLSAARTLLMGATFTAEYAVEAVALCNPSAVLHPDQSGLRPGQARIALSLRAIGEGHLSSIVFASAVVGTGSQWSFDLRVQPSVRGISSPAHWRQCHLRAVLAERGRLDGLAETILAALPNEFTERELELALAEAPQDLLVRPGGQATVELLRHVVTSAYEVTFPPDVELSQQVLCPATAEESNGLEDARFIRFTASDGLVSYRATYTAYDGQHIAPRLLISPDLRTFHAHRLAGIAARNKGMALFPRLVEGQHVALCRSDGESTSIARSVDGFVWGEPEQIQAPEASWEVLQVGNCGAPIETDQGWLVVTHGVGPMRTYSMGAMLLDIADPTRVLARLEQPLLRTMEAEREGYVPNVVYSCGSVVHDGRLWLPYGIGDARIAVAWASLEELLYAMVPVTRVNTST